MRHKLRQRFLSAGLTEPAVEGRSRDHDLVFEGGGIRVCIIIVDHSHWADRRALMDAMMRASALVGKVNRTYLALPRMTGAIADARLFLDRGIGLYIFDQRDVEEVLPARYFENTTLSPSPPSGAETDQLRNEIHDLRAQFDLLEQRIHELRQEFTASTKSRSRAEPVIAAAPVPHPSSVSIFSNVPTYLVGNPWVEVLSRRGREDATIAG